MPENEYLKKVEKMVRLRGLTEGSVKDYLNMCRRFLKWCADMEVEPSEIAYEQVQDYVLHLLDVVKYAPKTVNSNISFLRFFFIYVLHRPIDRYMLPYCRIDLKEPEILSPKEIAAFISALPNMKAKVMVTLLYSCGLRSSEVVSLRYKDISRERKTIYIEHAKNRSARYVPLSDVTLEILTQYWQKCGKPTEWLFPGAAPGSHIRKDTLFEYIKTAKVNLGWNDRRITSHTFRHCIGTHMYEAGYDLPYIQKFLGHKRITSTMVYITLTGEKDYPNPFDSLAGGISLG